MTASATPSAGTDAQEPKPPKLTPKAQARLHEIKARNAMVVAISNESWGAKLTQLQQRAFAEYMRRFNLDISEIDNLGGRPYRNGRYYMRRGAELTREGRLVAFHGEHIGPDAQLDRLAATESVDAETRQWARAESVRRLRERIRHAVPQDATHAYVVTLTMRIGDGDTTITMQGCKWYVPGRTKMGWHPTERGKRIPVPADPVGDENPITSVETRAWRRAGRLAFAEIPELRDQEAEMEFAADATQEAVIAEAVRADEETAAAAHATPPINHGGDDPYGIEKESPRALGEGAAQPVAVPTHGERVAATVPDRRDDAQAEYVEFQDDRDLVD